MERVYSEWLVSAPFIMRHSKVYEILKDARWRTKLRKLVDFGSNDCRIANYLYRLPISEIFFVDIDENVTRPSMMLLNISCSFGRGPLDMYLFEGCASKPDYRLNGTDVVTAIELIEHLYPDTLEAFTYNVFSYIRPKLAIISTPNIEYNVFFRYPIKRFRHADHKFEWTREQFQDWCHNIVQRFPDYTSQLFGVGEYVDAPKCFGYCSQMVLFIRKDLLDENYTPHSYSCICGEDSKCKQKTELAKLLCKCVCPHCVPEVSFGICTYSTYAKSPERCNTDCSSPPIYPYESDNPPYNNYYTCTAKIGHGFWLDDRSEEDKILDCFYENLKQKVTYRSKNLSKEKGKCLFIVEHFTRELDVTEEEIKAVLEKHGYILEYHPDPYYSDGSAKLCIVGLPPEIPAYDSSNSESEEEEENDSDW